MTKHFNKSSEKIKRRKLRQNQTEAEKLIWRFLRNRQLLGYKIKRQYSIDHFVVDFYCPELKLAVEADGGSHIEPERKKYDIRREKYLKKFGVSFVRIKDEELFGNPNKAFAKIEDAIKKLKEGKI
jgi:very-short-patch-repair endonuclease